MKIKITKRDIERMSKLSWFEDVTLPVERDFLLNIIIKELYLLSIWELLVFKWWTALKKVFFWQWFDTYRFSKDLDFNIIKDISIDSIENFIDELIYNLEEKYALRFERLWGIWEWDYWFKSYALKIKLRDRWYIFNENVRIKFDFAIRPDFNKKYSQYKINNHYQEFFNEDVYCYCEDIETILHDKFLALVWPEYRTEPKDFFDIVSLIKTWKISDESLSYIINQFNPILDEKRLSTIRYHWDEFFTDQLPYVPDIEYYLTQYDYIVDKFYQG